MKLRHFVRYWMPVIIWMVIIFAASTDMMSGEQTSRFIGPFLRWLTPDIAPATIAAIQLLVRKSAHVIEYAILGALLFRAFGQGKADRVWGYALAAFGVAVAWAGIDELHQSFTASRTGSPIDVMIDASGALLGLALYWTLTLRQRASARALAA